MRPTFIIAMGTALALGTALQLRAQEKTFETINVTGCLQTTDAKRGSLPTGATGTSGREFFVLTNVHPSQETPERLSKRKDQPPTPGATGGAAVGETQTAPSEGASRSLNGSDNPWFSVAGDLDGLRKGVGHRVQITGKLDTAGSVFGTSASVTDGPSGTIYVTRLIVIGARCE